jgi:hypothetical protein
MLFECSIRVVLHIALYQSSLNRLSPSLDQATYSNNLSLSTSFTCRYEQSLLPPLPSQRRSANHRLSRNISTQHHPPRPATIQIILQHTRTSKEESWWSQERCSHS